MVDGEGQIVLAQPVTNQAPDQEHLIPLMDRVQRRIGRPPVCLTADAGYMSEDNVAYCQDHGIDAHIAPGRHKHGVDALREDPQPEHQSQVWLDMLSAPQPAACV